jgi:hypothetical protein
MPGSVALLGLVPSSGDESRVYALRFASCSPLATLCRACRRWLSGLIRARLLGRASVTSVPDSVDYRNAALSYSRQAMFEFQFCAHSASTLATLCRAKRWLNGPIRALLLSLSRLFQAFNVKLLHLHHGLHDSLRFLAVAVLQQF